jgi:hypothetical protein
MVRTIAQKNSKIKSYESVRDNPVTERKSGSTDKAAGASKDAVNHDGQPGHTNSSDIGGA